MEFNDRRPSASYDETRRRLNAYDVKLRSRGGGSHDVIVDGQHIGSIYRDSTDLRDRAYIGHAATRPDPIMASDTREVIGATKAQAAREMVAWHDTVKHRVAYSDAHADHVDPVRDAKTPYDGYMSRQARSVGLKSPYTSTRRG